MKLIEINKGNWEEVVMLTTDKEGKHPLGEEYVASNAYSIVQSMYEDGWTVKAIENDGELIGFTMYGFSEEEKFYEICRFMIDRKYQGRGLGQKSLALIIKTMKNEFKCDEIYLSVDPRNLKAKYIYEKLGFIFTGKVLNEGELYDEEELYKLKFN